VNGSRPYTGTNDGISKGKREGTEEFVRQMAFLSDGGFWNNGTFIVRKMKGKESLSVHATGRAMDVSYRNMRDGKRGKPNGRKIASDWCDILSKNADVLQVEMIIDYAFGKFGRAWRCDRNAWQTYDKPTVTGGGNPSSDWLHIEISPRVADDAEKVMRKFRKVFMGENDGE
jgi:hypothetical protein